MTSEQSGNHVTELGPVGAAKVPITVSFSISITDTSLVKKLGTKPKFCAHTGEIKETKPNVNPYKNFFIDL